MELAKAIERSTYLKGNKEQISWFNVSKLMNEDRSPEYYRAQYRRQMGTHDPKQKVRVSANKAKAQGHTEPKSILAQELKKTRTIDELIKATGMNRLEVLGTIEELRLNGYDIIQARYGDEVAYSVNQKIEQTFADYKHYHTTSKKIKIGIVSDTHMGSKYFQKSFLDRAYDDFMEKGITDVYHAGDITDGFYTNRPSSIYELYAIGFDQQADDVVKNYPRRDGITTHFLTGNHDATHVVNGGANIGKAIAKNRQDMKYLGHEFAKIWLTPKVDMDMVHPRDGSCFDDKTQILTKRGWIDFIELNEDDVVATMTKSEHEFQWQKPTHITKQMYDGNMYHFKARCLDMMVTPNHGLWVRNNPIVMGRKETLTYPTKSHYSANYDWQRVTAKDAYDGFRRQKWQMTNHCNSWNGEQAPEWYEVPRVESKNIGMKDKMAHIGKVKFDDFIELVAWYVTEGHADYKRVTICQSNVVNPELHKRITDLLNRMGIKYSISGIEDKNITIGSVELSKHLRDICGHLSRFKYLPNFIKELEAPKLNIVFDTMIQGDGWYRSKESFGYKSISEKLRNDFSEIAVKLGYAISENNETVSVSVTQKKPTVNTKPTIIPYKGMIFCVSVPNGLIYVRRNGKATWSHNSYAMSYKLQKRIDAMSGGSKPKVMVTGHYHKNFSMFYRNIYAMSLASFQAQSSFMRGLGLVSDVGYVILDIEVNENGDIIEFTPTYKALYVTQEEF